MSHVKDLIYFSNNINDWNYNQLVQKPNIDPYSVKNKEIKSYNGKKWNSIIILKELLKHCNFNNDVKIWINKKCFDGSKCDYWDIINITGFIFHYVINGNNNDEINYKDFRKWCLKNAFNDSTFKNIDDFDGDDTYTKNKNRQAFIRLETYNKFNNNIVKIEDEEYKNKMFIILGFFKEKILGECCYSFKKLC